MSDEQDCADFRSSELTATLAACRRMREESLRAIDSSRVACEMTQRSIRDANLVLEFARQQAELAKTRGAGSSDRTVRQ